MTGGHFSFSLERVGWVVGQFCSLWTTKFTGCSYILGISVAVIKKTEVIFSFVPIHVHFKSYIKLFVLLVQTGRKLQETFC